MPRTDRSGGGLALTYNAMNGTDIRGELGSRFDDFTTLGGLALVLRTRLAWAHDWASNPALNASFQSLAGSGFTVNGAPVPRNSALASTGVPNCTSRPIGRSSPNSMASSRPARRATPARRRSDIRGEGPPHARFNRARSAAALPSPSR